MEGQCDCFSVMVSCESVSRRSLEYSNFYVYSFMAKSTEVSDTQISNKYKM